ncbi:MAG: substrate-binding domain-containing protein, partial [Oscillospiraceae bacterium]
RTRVMPKIDRVTVDDCGGVYQAVEALIGKNKKRIAYIGSAPLGSVEAERLIGYQKAMRAHSLPCDLIYAEGGYTNRDGYLGAQTILARCKETDAFFCASDILASGVLQYLYQKKIRVPEDLSVTGYDDTIATLLSPPISSVALSLETLGKSAVQLLLARVEDYEKEDEEIRTETIYIERDT